MSMSVPSSLDVLVAAAITSSEETALTTVEDGLANFPKAAHVDCHEIHGIVPRSTRKMEGSSTTQHKESTEAQIFSVLREMVAQKVAELRLICSENTNESTTNPPEDIADPETVRQNMSKVAPAKPAKRSSTKVGEISASFKLPEDFPQDIEVETRLEGWTFTRSKRPQQNEQAKAVFDNSYLHHQSNTKLRSMEEVVSFILYEDPKQRAANQRKLEGDQLAKSRRLTGSASMKRKRKSSDADCSNNVSENLPGFDAESEEELTRVSVEPSKEEMVKQFLKSAYENLMNYKFTDGEEERAEATKTKQVKVPGKKGNNNVAPSSPNVVSPKNTVEFEQAYPENHVEVGHGNPTQIEGEVGAKPLETTEVRAREASGNARGLKAYEEECDLINHIPLDKDFVISFV